MSKQYTRSRHLFAIPQFCKEEMVIHQCPVVPNNHWVSAGQAHEESDLAVSLPLSHFPLSETTASTIRSRCCSEGGRGYK